MKKIINAKMYNTDTAKELGAWGKGNNTSLFDFTHCAETLYQKTTGEYFLFGEGGPLSKYAEHCGCGSTDGSKIIPLSIERARDWAEEHISADAYVALFGSVPE